MKKIIPLIVSVAFLLVSCKEDVTPKISLSVYNAEIDYTGGEISTMVYSNADWTASCTTEGVSYPNGMKAGDNLITVKVPSTDSDVTRSIKIEFLAKGTSASATTKLIISQSPAPYLSIDKTAATVPAAGGQVIVIVESNDTWTAACTNPAYIIAPETGNAGKTTVEIIVPANTTGEQVAETVTFSMKNLTGTVKISQN